MILPKIEIIDDWAYIGGERLKKKVLRKSLHCRDIFYNDDIVIKVPTKTEGYDDGQSLREFELWKFEIEKEDKVYFAPILKYKSDEYIVQKRIKMKSRKRINSDSDIIHKMCEKYNIDDLYGRPDNWCINYETNLPCIFDYGIQD